MRRKGTADPVTPDVANEVFERDHNSCVASALGVMTICEDVWGQPIIAGFRRGLELHHVHEGYGKTGKRAPSDKFHLVCLCHLHHDGWARSHVHEIRAYLGQHYAMWKTP
jgi:hypothetical protein